MAKMLLLDVQKQEVREVEANGLDDYYKLLNCDTIDIVTREVVSFNKIHKEYDIICDDNGLLKDNIIISAVDVKDMSVQLVGNLLVCNFDSNGNEKSLSGYDIELLKNSILDIVSFDENFKPKTMKVLKLWM